MTTMFDVPDFSCSRRVPPCSRRYEFGYILGTSGNMARLVFPCSPLRRGTWEQGCKRDSLVKTRFEEVPVI